MKKLFKAVSVALSLSLLASCASVKNTSNDDEENDENVEHVISVYEGNDEYDLNIHPLLNKVTIDDSVFCFRHASEETIAVDYLDKEIVSVMNEEKVSSIERDVLYKIQNTNIYLVYGDFESACSGLEDALVESISEADVSKEKYVDFVYDQLGESLTDEDLSSDIRVTGATYHHVSLFNTTTIIFLQFPDELMDTYFDYYSSEIFENYGYPLYTYRGDDYFIISSSPSSYFISNDNCMISIASYDDIDSELTAKLMGFPSPSFVYGVLELMDKFN